MTTRPRPDPRAFAPLHDVHVRAWRGWSDTQSDATPSTVLSTPEARYASRAHERTKWESVMRHLRRE